MNRSYQNTFMMQYRRFGRTELPMPVFSCGGMRYIYTESEELTQDKIPDENQRNLEATIRRSLEVGINHIETARMYGTSEMQLGAILPKLPREKLLCKLRLLLHLTLETSAVCLSNLWLC